MQGSSEIRILMATLRTLLFCGIADVLIELAATAHRTYYKQTVLSAFCSYSNSFNPHFPVK
jgi:hypothetical protein